MSDTTSDFTEAELNYFSSKGEKTEGLDPPPESSPEAPQPAAQPAAPDPSSSPPPEASAASPDRPGAVDEDEGIYLDESGRARNANGKFVPHAALHKERERRKSVETELVQQRDRMARAEERLAILNEALTAPAVQQPHAAPQGPPDPEQDIFAYVKWQAQEIDRLKQTTQQREQVEAQRQGVARLEEAYKQDALSYMQERPDFPDAYKFIAQSYFGELKSLGYSEAEARQRLSIEESNLAAEAFQRGVRPAQVIYERARARGYAPKAAQTPVASAQPDPAQKLNNIAQAQAAQKSLGGAGGSPSEGLTVEALANMSEAEFEAVYKKLGKSKMRDLMGG